MDDLNDKPEVQPKRTPQRELIELYPDCFNLKKPRPLKVGIRQDLLAAGHASKLVNSVMYGYCQRIAYLRAMRIGTARIDLQGQPAGEVTEAAAIIARDELALLRPVKSSKPKPPSEPTPVLPLDAPLTSENIVSGHLELTVKLTELPTPVVVKAGMKIGFRPRPRWW
ncbi:ProQ/FINO family protein [Chromatium okenii]|nr:ProQ/FinO family protein [Chromatium okenii]